MSEEVKTEKQPSLHDPEWSDWVLGQLAEDELINGSPKTDGLRRLLEKYVGEIVDVTTHVMQCPNVENLGRAVVVAKITIDKKDETGLIRSVRFSGSADVCARNCDAPYNQYPVATAETRALGRAYRQALRVRKAAAEELSENAEYAAESPEDNMKITDAQINGIESLCKRLNINLQALVNAGTTEYPKITEVSLSKATNMIKLLGDYQRNNKEIPEKFQGYDKSWRSTFGG